MPVSLFIRCAVLLAGFWSGWACAFERADGVTVQCEIDRAGQRHVVREVWLGHGDAGDRHPELGGAAAVVRPDAAGLPVIYFDSVVLKPIVARDPHMADFIFYHECAHANDESLDEIQANCQALMTLQSLGQINDNKLTALANTHNRMLRLPSRYGGNGQVFWERTLACVARNAGMNPLDAR